VGRTCGIGLTCPSLPERKRRKGKEKKKEDGNAAATLIDGGSTWARGVVPEVGDVSGSNSSRTNLGNGVAQAVLLTQPQHLGEQRPQLLQVLFAEGRDAVVVGVLVAREHLEGHVLVRRPLDPTR